LFIIFTELSTSSRDVKQQQTARRRGTAVFQLLIVRDGRAGDGDRCRLGQIGGNCQRRMEFDSEKAGGP